MKRKILFSLFLLLWIIELYLIVKLFSYNPDPNLQILFFFCATFGGIGIYFLTKLLGKKKINPFMSKDDFLNDMVNLSDDDFFQVFIDKYNYYYFLKMEGLLGYLIKYEKIKTIKYLISQGLGINGYEEELSKLLPKTYLIPNRYHEDFVDYFADRL